MQYTWVCLIYITMDRINIESFKYFLSELGFLFSFFVASQPWDVWKVKGGWQNRMLWYEGKFYETVIDSEIFCWTNESNFPPNITN